MSGAALSSLISNPIVLASDDVATSTIVWSLVAAAVLILLNGFFVAWEFAILAARRSSFEAGAEQGRAVDKAAQSAFSDLSLQLAGAQLGITMATLVLGFVGEPAIDALLLRAIGDGLSEDVRTVVAFGVALAIVSFLHLVVGEMIPKNIAIAAAEPTVRWLVMPYRAYLLAFGPVVKLLNALANGGCRLIGVEPRDEIVASHSVAEITAIVARSTEEGAIEGESAELLRGALDFAERPVSEVCRTLDDVATIRLGATVAHAEATVRQTGQTRIPVVAPALGAERFVGYLHAKDLLGFDTADRRQLVPESLVRRMAVLDHDEPLVEALRVLRRRRRHLALIVDADGPIGVVSVEEIVRALVDHGDEARPGLDAATVSA